MGNFCGASGNCKSVALLIVKVTVGGVVLELTLTLDVYVVVGRVSCVTGGEIERAGDGCRWVMTCALSSWWAWSVLCSRGATNASSLFCTFENTSPAGALGWHQELNRDDNKLFYHTIQIFPRVMDGWVFNDLTGQ